MGNCGFQSKKTMNHRSSIEVCLQFCSPVASRGKGDEQCLRKEVSSSLSLDGLEAGNHKMLSSRDASAPVLVWAGTGGGDAAGRRVVMPGCG